MSSKVTATCYGSPPWLQALAIRMVASPVEDLEYEFIDGEEELYSDVNSARTAITNTVLSPPDVVGVGTVAALWRLGADDEWALVGSCDLVKLARHATEVMRWWEAPCLHR